MRASDVLGTFILFSKSKFIATQKKTNFSHIAIPNFVLAIKLLHAVWI